MSFSSDQPSLVNQLPVSLDLPKTWEQAHEIISIMIKLQNDAINKKEGSLYIPVELGNFQSYYTRGDANTFRNAYRKVFDLVGLNGNVNIGAGATVTFPHGITGLFQSAGIRADCTSVTPTFFSVMGQPTVYLTSTDVVFTNPLAVALTCVNVVADYLKN
jgi:hypothetical protein